MIFFLIANEFFLFLQDLQDVLAHMKSCHKFDMCGVMKDFSFYDKVKAVNYIRTRVGY